MASDGEVLMDICLLILSSSPPVYFRIDPVRERKESVSEGEREKVRRGGKSRGRERERKGRET